MAGKMRPGDPGEQADGVRRWVGNAPVIVLVGGSLLAIVWMQVAPARSSARVDSAAMTTATAGQRQRVDKSDLVAGQPVGTPPPTPVARRSPPIDLSDLGPGQREKRGNPTPTSPATSLAPPPPPAPTLAPTISPAQLVAAARAQADRAAGDEQFVNGSGAGSSSSSSLEATASPSVAPTSATAVALVPHPDTPFLTPHTVIPVSLYTSMNSTIPGAITGTIGQDVLDHYDRCVMIPEHATIIGQMSDAQVQAGQTRVRAIWTGILLPSGDLIPLDHEPGIDMTGTIGFGAAIDNHTRAQLLNVIAYSILSAGLQLAQPQNLVNNSGNTSPSAGQSIAQSAGTQLSQFAMNAYNRSAQIPPTAHVVEGAQVGVMITGFLTLPNGYCRLI